MIEDPQGNYSEDEIISGIKEKNEDILRFLITKLKPLVYHWIKRHGGTQELAEDNFQDTWMVVLINIHFRKYKQGNFMAYFKKISRNIWNKKIPRAKIKIENLEDFQGIIEDISEEELYLKLMKDIRYEIVYRSLNKLSKECKKIIELKYFDSVKSKDIPKHMAISDDYVRVKSKRCRDKLKDLILNDPNFRMD
ncbi:MAG: sigma-70 family RNA polymerase sigma factor [Candidatus Paceibacterota bacterium]